MIDEQEKVKSKKVGKKNGEDDIDMEIEKGEEKPVIKKAKLRETTKRLINVVDNDEDSDIENDENVTVKARTKKVVDEKENVKPKKKTKFDLKINNKEKSVKKFVDMELMK